MKILLLEDGYPSGLLEGFEVVRTPQEDVVAALTIDEPVDAEMMDRLPSLRVVATATVGFDHIDVGAAGERGVAVVSVPDYCTQEVADHAIALLYALVRGVVALDVEVRRGVWNAKAAGPLRTLAEVRVGIVGLGRIGNAVATRLLALGVEVWAHDIVPAARDGVRFADLDELLTECDAVTLHVPLTPETHDLIGRAQIAAMKPDAYLVNTARGAVVDVGAVLEALRAGRLAGAALDVLPHEPPPLAPLAPRLVLTPHAAWYSEAAEGRAYRLAVARVRELLGA
ncbi:MAG TPA: NAD(P)-dependent oxidoreductase [Gaiellaceae bacterium]